MLLNAAKWQGYSFYPFWVIKGKPRKKEGGGGLKCPLPPLRPTQIRVNTDIMFLDYPYFMFYNKSLFNVLVKQ